jgi:hypothetical protein
MIALMNMLLGLTLFDDEVTTRLEWTIIASIAMLLDLAMRTTHDIRDSIDKTLVTSLHIIALKIRYTIILFERTMCAPTMSNNSRFCLTQVMVMTSLVLKVYELLRLLDIH